LKQLEEKVLALKKDENLYFLFIDLDSFKQVNDKHGHNEGDRALKTVASVLKSVCDRTGGFCARYGGDEFAVVQILGTDGNIDDVRKEICDLIERKGAEQALAYNISVSIGYAEYPKQAKNIQDLIYCADSDMYDVKMKKKQTQ
ncbi:MAG: GGDEF domain-containing protein, partial [Acutalibacteraceae bacterium]|nr:GGDEF domain-containing protein [Acutalibacteraceae bacterium]